ncbi:MAG: hypothetical protein CMI52_02585 [Parcubacteria group bacterium]|mgnify:CR=1 FL=1|nr:hypothetical protein [Parcubacteria group bacterium]|tara:strand:- start:492 stop:821 length:330 start_codon:yes stop_codon:yes gene_type:complete
MKTADVWEVMLDQLERAREQFMRYKSARYSKKNREKWTLGLGKVQGLCNLIIASSNRIPHTWKLRMIKRLEEMRKKPLYTSDGDWYRCRIAIDKAIRHLTTVTHSEDTL